MNFSRGGKRIDMENIATFNKQEIKLDDLLIKEPVIRKYIIDTSVVFKWYYKKDGVDFRRRAG